MKWSTKAAGVSCSKNSLCSLSLPSLQLAALNSANEHNEVKCVFDTLLAIWKALHYSLKKAEKLIEVEPDINIPELKIGKPSNTQWLSRGHCVGAVKCALTALVQTFGDIYDESGDPEALSFFARTSL